MDLREPVVIGPPLRGERFVSADGCCDAVRHTRADLPVNGRLRVAQRIAVDWEQLDGSGRIYSGPRETVRSGNSVAPHLHFHVMDGPSALDANGLPYLLDAFLITGASPGTEAFDHAEAEGTPLAIQPVTPPRRVTRAHPLDQQILSFWSPAAPATRRGTYVLVNSLTPLRRCACHADGSCVHTQTMISPASPNALRNSESFYRAVQGPVVVFDAVHQLPDPGRLLKIRADELPRLALQRVTSGE